LFYLDHNATSPLRPESLSAVTNALSLGGNPSSIHAKGRAARAIVEDARERIVDLVNGAGAQVI
jgi:cysteine desulfurase